MKPVEISTGCWAHFSEEEAPNVPYFNEEAVPKRKNPAGMSIAENVAAAVVTTMTALGSSSQSTPSNLAKTSLKDSFFIY